MVIQEIGVRVLISIVVDGHAFIPQDMAPMCPLINMVVFLSWLGLSCSRTWPSKRFTLAV